MGQDLLLCHFGVTRLKFTFCCLLRAQIELVIVIAGITGALPLRGQFIYVIDKLPVAGIRACIGGVNIIPRQDIILDRPALRCRVVGGYGAVCGDGGDDKDSPAGRQRGKVDAGTVGDSQFDCIAVIAAEDIDGLRRPVVSGVEPVTGCVGRQGQCLAGKGEGGAIRKGDGAACDLDGIRCLVLVA